MWKKNYFDDIPSSNAIENWFGELIYQTLKTRVLFCFALLFVLYTPKDARFSKVKKKKEGRQYQGQSS